MNFTNKLHKIVEERRLYLNPHLNINDLARELTTNRTYISNYFNREINSSFNDYVNNLRLKEVEYLLRTTKENVANVAKLSGFNSLRTMQRAFVKKHKLTPTEYREIYKVVLK
ncbi:MAG: helix-turn-helix transcriptional regulator [Bacteroidaceae bacterium]|nr:helix-turn-helix transcriptional regulator [Bacteroidaceae bacterium]